MAVKLSRHKIAEFLADRLAAGESPRRVAKILAAYLIDTRTTRQAELILREITAALADKHGHLAVEVTAARRLNDETRQAIATLVKANSNARKVELIESVDPDLIGGAIVRTPDAEMDNSVRGGLRKLGAV
jgi:ATP synthase F1 delta subunit